MWFPVPAESRDPIPVRKRSRNAVSDLVDDRPTRGPLRATPALLRSPGQRICPDDTGTERKYGNGRAEGRGLSARDVMRDGLPARPLDAFAINVFLFLIFSPTLTRTNS
jgi:hypothetical protein